MSRAADIAAGLERTHARVAEACAAVGRDPSELTVIVITKTYPATDVEILSDLGVRDVGENRDQEAAAKAVECAGLPVRWHFVGQLQSNKANSVARYASVVHSVDRPRLVRALDRAADGQGRRLDCLVQVSLDGAPGRGGVPADGVPEVAGMIADAHALRLAGMMAVAPLEAEPGAAFARLAQISEQLRADHPEATWISAGMSADMEAAIAHGATHLRVGSAILGKRPYPG